MDLVIKKCGAEDIPELYAMTKELIDFHDMDFTLTVQRLAELVLSGAVQSYICTADGKPAGCMTFFYKYTTFSGRRLIYLEDFYTREEFRGQGIGSKMFEELKCIGRATDCERIEWKCAHFNDGAKIFYDKLGGKADDVWATYTIEREDF